MRRYDVYWKGVIEDLAEDFVRFFYPEADTLFDFSRGIVALEQELVELFPEKVEDPVSVRRVDKLLRLHTWKGTESWIFLHVEVQGYGESDFAFRMFRYYFRIRDRYPDIPITALAFFTDEERRFHPKAYTEQYLGTELRYSFGSYKLLDQKKEELEASPNPFAAVVLTALTAVEGKRFTEGEQARQALELARRLLVRGFPRAKISAILDFMSVYLRFEDAEIMTTFTDALDGLKQAGATMGLTEQILKYTRLEGLLEGKQEGKQEGLLEGKQEGLLEGKQKSKLETAVRLKQLGIEIKLIAQATDLTEQEIELL